MGLAFVAQVHNSGTSATLLSHRHSVSEAGLQIAGRLRCLCVKL